MWKYILFVLGGIFVLMGLADWAAGALVPHGRYLLGIGAVLMAPATPNVVAAVIKYLRKRSQRRKCNREELNLN